MLANAMHTELSSKTITQQSAWLSNPLFVPW